MKRKANKKMGELLPLKMFPFILKGKRSYSTLNIKGVFEDNPLISVFSSLHKNICCGPSMGHLGMVKMRDHNMCFD